MDYKPISIKKTGKKFKEIVETQLLGKDFGEPNTITKKAIAAAKGSKTKRHNSASSLVTTLNK